NRGSILEGRLHQDECRSPYEGVAGKRGVRAPGTRRLPGADLAWQKDPVALRRHAAVRPVSGSRSKRLSVKKIRLSPRSRPSGLYHSFSVRAPPPCPPAPIETAGIPSASGMFASVEEQSRRERIPRYASTART